MALPIRLLLANGKDEIDLVAQSIDMSVNRNVSAFPTPNNALKRFAVDTNIPAIKIDINGIFADDEGAHVDSGSTVTLDSEPIRSAINFGALLPTDRNNLVRRVGGLNNLLITTMPIGGWNMTEPSWIPSENIFKGQKNTISLLGRVGSDFEEASDDTEELDVNPSILFKSDNNYSGTKTMTVTPSRTTFSYSLADVINIGDRLTKSDGTLIGIVESFSNNDITCVSNVSVNTNDEIHASLRAFNHIGEEVGFVSYLVDDPSINDGDTAKYTLGLTDVNAADITQGQLISINRMPEILERFKDQTIKLIPSYWLENPPISNAHIDTSMESNLSPYGSTNSGGTGNVPRAGVRLEFDLDEPYTTAPSLTTSALTRTHALDTALNDAVINVPIQGIDGANNPALEMAKQVKDAFEISGNVVIGLTNRQGFNPAGDKTLASAFRVSRTGTVVTIEQVYNPAIETLHPQILSPDLTDLFGSVEFHSSNSTPTQSRKSAGDKAQDLIGLVSNANRNSDLLRGVQIPYDSLVTSTGVTGIARNFFLTFGEVDTTKKLSTNNNRSASQSMSDLLLGMDEGGASSDDSPDKWYEKILKAITPDEIESIFGFLVGAAKDALWITLSQRGKVSENDGGIRIIPEKLHVRYDAGNNYYAFNLELLVSDYVMGV